MAEQEKKKPVTAPACACGRGDLWMEANPQPPEADAEEQPTQGHERPGPHSRESAITAGPVKHREERD